jgi:hypothetical protein
MLMELSACILKYDIHDEQQECLLHAYEVRRQGTNTRLFYLSSFRVRK